MLNSKKKFVVNAFLVAILIITILLLLGRNHFFFGTILNFGRVLLGIILLLFVIFSIKKKIKIVCATLLVLVFFEYLLMTMSYKRVDIVDANLINQEIAILTYNLLYTNRDPLGVIKEIEKANPDILVVQELTPEWEGILDNKLGMLKYKSTKSLKRPNGLGIYSKYPLSESEFVTNSKGFPVAQRTIVDINQEKIELCNMHLSSPAIAIKNFDKFWYYYSKNCKSRENQYEEINRALSLNKKVKKQILIGDLNSLNYEPIYNQIRKDWIDLFAEKGKGSSSSFPYSSKFPYPFLTLDYIFIRGNIKGIESEVIKGGSSDHLGVKGVIEI